MILFFGLFESLNIYGMQFWNPQPIGDLHQVGLEAYFEA